MTTPAPHPFANATLFASARSPFARRVRVALLEAGVPFEEKIENVLEPTAELIAVNPLARVPTLRLTTGEVLVESQVILEHLFAGLGDGARRFRPTDLAGRRRSDLFSGLAFGLCEKAVEFFFDQSRPEPQRDPVVVEEVRACADRTMTLLEAALAGREHLVTDAACAADFDVTVALTYHDLRVDRSWKARFPRLAALQQRVEAREAFKKTVPPPPA